MCSASSIVPVEWRIRNHGRLGLVVLRELVPPHDAGDAVACVRVVLAVIFLVGVNEIDRALFVPALRAPAAPLEEPNNRLK